MAQPASAHTGQIVRLDAADRSGRIVSNANWWQSPGEPRVLLGRYGHFGAIFRAPWVASPRDIRFRMVLSGAGSAGPNGPPINTFVSEVTLTLLGGGPSPSPTVTPMPTATYALPPISVCGIAVEPSQLRFDDCDADAPVNGRFLVRQRDEQCCWEIRGPADILTIEPLDGCGDTEVTFATANLSDLPRRLTYLLFRSEAAHVHEASFSVFHDACPTPTKTPRPPMPTRTPRPPTATAVPSPTATAKVTGDCDGDRLVRVNEVIAVVKRALCHACSPHDAIPCSADIDGSGTLTIDELVIVIGNALAG